MSLLLTGCDPEYVEKTSETLSRGVYATADALNVGRIDLASSYINDVESLVPLPKNRIKIAPVISNGVSYVVLTDNLKGKSVVIVGTSDFSKLIKSNSSLQSQEKQAEEFAKETQTQLAHNQEVTNDILKSNESLKAEVTEYHNTAEYKVKHWIKDTWLGMEIGIPLLIVGLIVLCFVFPPAVPFIVSALGTICGTVVRFFTSLFPRLQLRANYLFV